MSKDIDLRLGRSTLLLVLAIGIFFLAVVAALLLQAVMMVKLLLIIVLIGSFVYTLRNILLLDKDAIIALQSKRADRIWVVKFASGVQLRLEHINARVFNSLVILQLKNPVNQRRYRCLVTADSVLPKEHSELRALVLALESSGDY